MMVIDGADALRSLRLRVEGREGFIYKEEERSRDEILDCLYAENGCPSCLVGQSLHYEFKVSVPDLLRLNGDRFSEDPSGDSSIGNVTMPPGVHLTSAARQIYGAAQEAQDGGATWAGALEAAEIVAKHLNIREVE